VNVLQQIQQWSAGRPLWQRDALRRLLLSDRLTPEDVEELVLLCKRDGGLGDLAKTALEARPLGAEHVGSMNGSGARVSLVAIRDVQNVNALASGRTLSFEPTGLTAVYGDNGSGKSGYTRILKRVCRARSSNEKIHANIFQGAVAGAPVATIDFTIDDEGHSHEWRDGERGPAELAGVSVFDSDCASVYVEKETDVAYRPLGLDLFTKLVDACNRVKGALTSELAALATLERKFPDLWNETAVGNLVRGLASKGSEAILERLAHLSEDEDRRLGELRSLVMQMEADEPKRRAAELRLRARRFTSLSEHAARVNRVLAADAAAALRRAGEAATSGGEAARLASGVAFEDEPLGPVGTDIWSVLWDAARRYSEAEVYPDRRFPVVGDGARCVFCQQPLADGSPERLLRFDEFVRQETQRTAERAAEEFAALRAALEAVLVVRPEDDTVLAELTAHNGEVGGLVREYLSAMQRRMDGLLVACESSCWEGLAAVADSPCAKLLAVVADLERAALELDAAELPEERRKLRAQHAELLDRSRLRAVKADVLGEIERQRLQARLKACLKLTDTTAITAKNTELTKTVVSEELRTRFQAELHALRLFHLTVSVEPKHGAKGVMYHQVEFQSTQTAGWGIREVLSEGEHRCIALAAFLAELATQPTASAVILDDPVSSLDHWRREVVAKRLVREAATRPVAILTHDLVFLLFLQEEAEKQGVRFTGRHLSREHDGLGVPVDGLPWYGMSLKKRIGQLRNDAVALTKTFKTKPRAEYEKEAAYLYGRLREAWECGVEEVLLNGSVKRFSRKVSTVPLRVVPDITNDDITAVETAMDACSTWMAGHDLSGAINTPTPGPEAFSRAVDDLDQWRSAIEKRRKAS
jgi:energy-coupling factor transporter ATP-binding protein EcfA2